MKNNVHTNRLVCIAGKNRIAVDACNFLLRNGFDNESLVVCCNETDQGINNWQPSLRFFCHQNKLRLVELEDLYEIEDLVFFSLEFDRIIRPSFFKSSALFNIHFSKLPAYKGMFTSVFPILLRERESGVTLHKIDRGIDTGEIIAQRSFLIPKSSRAIDLYYLYLIQAKQLFEDNFFMLLSGEFSSSPQSPTGSSYFGKNSIRFNNPVIDFDAAAYQVEAWIRALNFRPYQLPLFESTRISHAKILNISSSHKPGKVEQHSKKDFFDVTTIDYVIRLFPDQMNSIIESAKKDDVDRLKLYYAMNYPMDDWEEHGWTPLIVAAYHNSLNALKYLISVGANVNQQNFNGTTVLMYAYTAGVKSGNFECFDLLIESGANPEMKDYSGCSLMDYVEKNDNAEIADIINRKLFS